MINRPKTLDLLQHILTENELLFESFLNNFFLSYFSTGSVVKNLPANAGDAGLIPGSGRCPREGNSNPLQDSCLEDSMNRGDWRATVRGVAASDTTE